VARWLVLLAVLAAAVAALVVAEFRLADGDTEAAPCPAPRTRPIAGTARELSAGDAIWSAWLTYPPRAGDPATVLWRVAEDPAARFRVDGRDRDGNALRVAYGPSPVLPLLGGGGFPWRRAGREWGTRLVFPAPGCWRIHVEAGSRFGELEVPVGATP